jgi:hypothetical protein
LGACAERSMSQVECVVGKSSLIVCDAVRA